MMDSTAMNESRRQQSSQQSTSSYLLRADLGCRKNSNSSFGNASPRARQEYQEQQQTRPIRQRQLLQRGRLASKNLVVLTFLVVFVVIIASLEYGGGRTPGQQATWTMSCFVAAQDASWSQRFKLRASDAASADFFGRAVALYENRIVIGSYLDDNESVSGTGSAYIFERITTNSTHDDGTSTVQTTKWLETEKLFVTGGNFPVNNEQFGSVVAIYNNTVVIGAHRTESVYVYEYDASNGPGNEEWNLIQRINADQDNNGNDGSQFFGEAVAIYKDTIVIGALGNDVFGPQAGAVYVYRRNSGNNANDPWVLETRLFASDATTLDNFGSSVAIQGKTIVVGAPFDDDRGSAYIFVQTDDENDNGGWIQHTRLAADDGSKFDTFGFSVAIQGDRVLIGASSESSQASLAGAVYVFDRTEGTAGDLTSGTWVQSQKLVAADARDNLFFGASVALTDDVIAVGGNGDSFRRGAVYLFTKSGPGLSTWVQRQKLTASDGSRTANLGQSIALSGSDLVAGASGDLSASGSCYIFSNEEQSTIFTASPVLSPSSPPSMKSSIAPTDPPVPEPTAVPFAAPSAGPSRPPSSMPSEESSSAPVGSDEPTNSPINACLSPGSFCGEGDVCCGEFLCFVVCRRPAPPNFDDDDLTLSAAALLADLLGGVGGEGRGNIDRQRQLRARPSRRRRVQSNDDDHEQLEDYYGEEYEDRNDVGLYYDDDMNEDNYYYEY